MKCNNTKYGDLIYEYVFNQLEESEAKKFEMHLITCEYCQKEINEIIPLAGVIYSNQEEFEEVLKKNTLLNTETIEPPSPVKPLASKSFFDKLKVFLQPATIRYGFVTAGIIFIVATFYFFIYQSRYSDIQNGSENGQLSSENHITSDSSMQESNGSQAGDHSQMNKDDDEGRDAFIVSEGINESDAIDETQNDNTSADEYASNFQSDMPNDPEHPSLLSMNFRNSNNHVEQNTNFNNGLEYYRQTEYSRALSYFLICNNNDTVKFYIAMSYLYLSEWDASLEVFQTMNQINNQEIKEKSYSAIAYALSRVQRTNRENALNQIREMLRFNYTENQIEDIEEFIR